MLANALLFDNMIMTCLCLSQQGEKTVYFGTTNRIKLIFLDFYF